MIDLRFLTASPLFGVGLTAGTLMFYTFLFRKARTPLLNPLLFTIASIIGFLMAAGIPYENYAKGGEVLSFFLGPTIVALAIPLYKQFDRLKANVVPLFTAIFAGVFFAMSSIILLGKLIGISRDLVVTIMPIGTTSAISMNLSELQGGNPALTMFYVSMAGISGYMANVKVLDLLRVTSVPARGIAIGTVSHAMGVKRAFELGEEEGAFASLSLSITGIVTTVLMPVLTRLYSL